jgi:hypothetical protein
VLHAIIIDPACISGIIWRIDIDALYFPFVFRKERLEGKEIITMDEHILACRISIRFLDEDTRFDIRDIVVWMILSDPGEFEALGRHGRLEVRF